VLPDAKLRLVCDVSPTFGRVAAFASARNLEVVSAVFNPTDAGLDPSLVDVDDEALRFVLLAAEPDFDVDLVKIVRPASRAGEILEHELPQVGESV
jgi:hypothetical protein